MPEVHSQLSRVPNCGERFHFFDDGKTSPSRHFIVEITKVISWDQLQSHDLIKEITEEQKQCTWLYAPTTDYVLQGQLLGTDIEPLWFIRTHEGGWFSIDFWAGELDIDGSRFKEIIDNEFKYFKDCEEWKTLEDAKNWYNEKSDVTKEMLENIIE